MTGCLAWFEVPQVGFVLLEESVTGIVSKDSFI